MENIVSEVRAFNRFYTTELDILDKSYLNSSYSLSEVRILYEINVRQNVTAQQLSETVRLDKGYLSRILKGFLKEELIVKVASSMDKRSSDIKLTASGRKLLNELNKNADLQISEKLQKLSEIEKIRLVDCMKEIEGILQCGSVSELSPSDIVYRSDLRPGDIGYIIYLHSKIYGQESVFSNEFEAYVVKTFHNFLAEYSSEKDRLWFAEYKGEIIGCIAIIHSAGNDAQLRWFLSDPAFRGLGIGKKLLLDALEFCREKKYKSVFLLTTNLQQQAVKMYKNAGFKLTESNQVEQWGASFMEERYDLKL
ncbi:bifunctional helix-turn-helix transcriptional regulator/GNAT family N-acetyltransferase [Flavobacterium foetidum]|uniref:bifunctional helix-turn-helix transcriptional regulator/GNAT family N-acetyltransferase n=1 Tax=Flavobacterium foetidum TaxID=2026681 RepID=UPI0010749FE2|nr:helix-turn-helix domain-containing GNAT family N-acetyltransferase [Flavobacterium foetidum]KAF2510572.1 MarR family transcriptional regulator [Flavobacterium foetidum]